MNSIYTNDRNRTQASIDDYQDTSVNRSIDIESNPREATHHYHKSKNGKLHTGLPTAPSNENILTVTNRGWKDPSKNLSSRPSRRGQPEQIRHVKDVNIRVTEGEAPSPDKKGSHEQQNPQSAGLSKESSFLANETAVKSFGKARQSHGYQL